MSDWSSDVCSSDLRQFAHLDAERFANRDQILDRVISAPVGGRFRRRKPFAGLGLGQGFGRPAKKLRGDRGAHGNIEGFPVGGIDRGLPQNGLCILARSEEHTSELPSLMRISYAGFCLK